MSGQGTGDDRTNLERLRAGDLGRPTPRGFAAMSFEQRQEFARTHPPTSIRRNDSSRQAADRNAATRTAVVTKSVGTQTNRSGNDLFNPAKNLNALGGGKGGQYLSFLQKVYGADSENELVIKFQKELGLEPLGLYDRRINYRQSTQIKYGLQQSRNKCDYGNVLFAKK